MMYAVQTLHGSNFYTDDKEEAERVYKMLVEEQREEVELLEGKPGQFTKVK